MTSRIIASIRALALLALSLPLCAGAEDRNFDGTNLFHEGKGGGLLFRRESTLSVSSEEVRLSKAHVTVTYVVDSSADAPLSIDMTYPLPLHDLGDRSGAVVDVMSIKVDGKLIALHFDTVVWSRSNPEDITANFDAAALPPHLNDIETANAELCEILDKAALHQSEERCSGLVQAVAT